MSVSFPLDGEAVGAADDAFYMAHPEMIVEGRRVPIDPDDPSHAGMADEWIDLYENELDEPKPGKDDPVNPVFPCQKHWIKFQFLSQDGKLPLMGVAIEYVDPLGEELGAITDEQGLISLEDVPGGSYSLRCPLDGLTISEVFDVTGQRAAGAPVTSSSSDSPHGMPPHVQEDIHRGAEAPKDENALRAASVPWTPVAFAHVEERKVADGDNLEKLAKEVGITWKQLARFNFNGEEPHWINAQLRDLIGCTLHDEKWNYSFSSGDEPGLMFLPRPFEADGLAVDTVHIFEGKPVERPVWLELQTVDDFGYAVSNVPLTLVRHNGSDIAIATDEDGYWHDLVIVDGPVDVYHFSGRRAEFFSEVYEGRDLTSESKFERPPEFARLDPLLARRCISTIRVRGLIPENQLVEHDILMRRYGSTEDDLASARFVGQEAGHSHEEAGGNGG